MLNTGLKAKPYQQESRPGYLQKCDFDECSYKHTVTQKMTSIKSRNSKLLGNYL